MDTSNATTREKAIHVGARIKREFEEIIPLIQLNTEESLTTVTRKLRFLYKLIERFVDDEKENLLGSDKIALEFLQGQVLTFIKDLEEKTSAERLDS